MTTVKLAEIQGMVENQPIPKAERLALQLLEVFEADRLLDQEEFEEMDTGFCAFSGRGK